MDSAVVPTGDFFDETPKSKRLYVLIVVIIVIGFLIATSLYIFNNYHSLPQETYNETLIMSVPIVWTAPSGEQVSGVITYNPSTTALTQVVDEKTAENFPSGFTMSADMDELLGIRVGEEGMSLVRIQRDNLLEPITVATSSALGLYAALSSDETFAFLTFSLPSVVSSVTAEAQAAHIPEENISEYIMERTSALMLTDTDGYGLSIGHATPLSFSPDDQHLLVATTQEYEIITRTGDVVRKVEGLPEVKSPPYILFSEDRNYLVIKETDGPVMLYHFDWTTGLVTKLGEFTLSKGQGYGFGPADTFLLTAPTSVTAYTLAPETLGNMKQYEANLPPNVEIIGYEK